MQIQVNKLRETLALLKAAVPKKPSLKVLSSVKVGEGKVVATDLEVSIEVALDEAAETFLLPYHLVMDWLKNVPGNQVLTLTPNESKVELSWAGGQSTYQTGKVDAYPPLNEVEAKVTADVDGDVLVKALGLVAGHASTDKSRPVLTGVCLFLGDPVAVAASDGFRMAWQDVSGVAVPATDELKEVIIPARSAAVLAELVARSPRMAPAGGSFAARLVSGRRMQLELTEAKMKARCGPVTLTTRLIKGNFPNYKQLIPAEPPIQVRVFAPDMERALKGLSSVARDGSGIARLVWSGGAMTVSAQSFEVGSTSSIVPAEILLGGPERVAANVDKLLDYFRGKQGMVTMAVTSSSAPILFRSGTPPEVLVMPMGVQWDDEKPKPEVPVQVAPPAEQAPEPEAAAKPKRVVRVKRSQSKKAAKWTPEKTKGGKATGAGQE